MNNTSDKIRQKRKDLSPHLFHYTKFNILEKIANKDYVDLRATYYTIFGNDDYEFYRNSKGVIEDICKEYGWTYDPDMLAVKPFITSFCTNTNSEYMWKHYADGYKGIKLIFEKEMMLKTIHQYGVDEKGDKHNINNLECMSPCTYIENDDVKPILLRCLKNSSINNEKWSHFERLTLLLATLKNAKKFKAEEEYRYICLYSTVFTAEYSEVKNEPIFNNDPVPTFDYLHLHYPKKSLLGVEFGREITSDNMRNAISYLENNGYKVSNVESNTILFG